MARNSLDFGLLPELIGYELRRAHTRLFQHFAASVGRDGITPGLFGVLVLIEANPRLNQSRLSEALGIDRSTVVGVIDRLQERGLVRRAPSVTDRRAYALELTKAGAETLAGLKRDVRAHETDITRDLSAGELAQLAALLRRLA
ncbi:MAG: MarR family transcriptional regulator [Alphaproteobacteria bacterium]